MNQHFNHFNIQTGTHQQPSSTQHRDILHGDSSEVTDQASSQWTPHPLQGLPYHHGNQQQLQDGAPTPINPQSNAVPHQHILPSDRTLPPPQTLSSPSDDIQTSIQLSQQSSSLSADSHFSPNPPESFRTAYQQSTPNPSQDLPHKPTNQTNICTWHSTQGMIHSGSADNSLKKTVASQPASLYFSETAEQISSQPRLFLHPQASQHLSQIEALQPPALTQHHGMPHGDSSVVTDQTYSPYPHHVLPHIPAYRCTIQQHLQRIPISYPSDGTQISIQQSSSLSGNSQFAPNPPKSFKTPYQQGTPSSPQDLPHEPTNQTNMYTWYPTQGMIHSGGSANSVNVTTRTVASQSASPFSETAEQISNQPQLFLHPQASQHISQTGALQQPSSTQSHGMPHGDSSVVTDQTYSVLVLPHRPPYHCTIQRRRPISYPRTMPNSRQHTFPSNGQSQSLIHHSDSSFNMTTGQYSQGIPHPHHNQPPLPHNPHQVQPYRPPPHQTSRQSAPYPLLHPEPVPHQGVTPQLISPHHPGYSHSHALNTPYQHPHYHHQYQDGLQFRDHSQMYLLQGTHDTSSITHLGLPPPPVKQYFRNQSGYAHMDSSAANLASVEPTKPHCSSTSQPTTLSANRTDSAASTSPMSLDAPDPKRARLFSHSSTTPRALEVGLPEPCVASLPKVASSYTSCDNASIVGLPSSSQNHSSNEHLDASPLNAPLCELTFNIVYDRLFLVCSKWHNFGLALGLHENTLNRIKCNNSDCEDCLRETLSVRINDKPLTWRDVVSV